MKQIKIIAIILFSALAGSCGSDYLDPAPKSAIGSNGFYTNPEEIEAAVVNMYDGLQLAVQEEWALTEMRSDNSKTRSSEGVWAEFEDINVQPTNSVSADYWALFFNVIFRTNTVLDNLDAAGSSAAQFEGEAKFVRALSYFNLVRLYGDVPLIDKVITQDDKEYLDRDAKDDVYALIISDLQTAIQNLDNQYKGRASKAAAQALLAKVYLTLGTNYSDAQLLCEAVLNPASGYTLQTNYNDIFYNEGNSEIIFAIEYQENLANDAQTFSLEFTYNGRVRGLNYATDELVTALTDFGGTARTATSIISEDGSGVDTTVPADIRNYRCGKFVGTPVSNPLAGNDWIVLRLADVYLMHVEAIMAGGSETSASTARNSFNEIRLRAGMPIINAPNPVTKLDLANERRVELAFENHRWFDLVRLGLAETVLAQFAADNAAEGVSYTSTDLLLPIPQREIGVSFGLLTQNPGY